MQGARLNTTPPDSLRALTLGPAKDRHAEIAGAAQQFEQIFAQMLISNMRQTASFGGGEGLFGDGPGADTYTQWFDTLMSEHLGGAGGIGLRKKLIEEWDRPNLVPPTMKKETTDVVA